MATNRTVTLLILAFSFIAVANSLKCMSSICVTPTGGVPTCQSPPRLMECNQPMPGMQGLPDKCMTLNATMKMQVVGEVITVTRNCSYSAICAAPQMMCGAMPNATACTLKCCDTDNCNKDVGPTQVPQPTGPSGADLSCLECSNMPGFPSISCENPVKRTCGNDQGYGPQDRCLTIKGSRLLNGTLQHLEMRNCSNKMQCAFDMCKMANTTLLPGKISSCVQKCCIGNNCNDPSITTPPPSSATTVPVGPTASANRFETGLVAIFSLLILAFVAITC